MLTYGSPLRRLYLRAFPNYFNEKVINDIAARGGRWPGPGALDQPVAAAPTRSVARSGSATGGSPIRIAFDALPGDRIPPAVRAHSGYQVTPQFGQAMDDLVGLLQRVAPVDLGRIRVR